ncbi:MAG: site-specific integrase [Pseudomonadota bacterium]
MDRYAREVSSGKRGYHWEQIRLERLQKDVIGEKAIGDLRPSDFADWRDRRLRDVSGASVKREMNLLSAVLHHARREWGLIDKSPLTDVGRPKEPPARRRRPTKIEMEAMRLAAGGNYTRTTARAYAAFEFACETAMRAGEIAGLRMENVSYSSAVAHLPETKNGEARDVPLSPRAIEILQAMPDQDLLFNVTSAQISALFAKVRNRAAIEGLTFHDSRREGTTRLSKVFNPMELARITGHKDLRMLMVYYEESAEELAKRLR